MTRANRALRACFIIIAIALAAPRIARAETITWTGNGDAITWASSANWDLLRQPAAGDDVVIPDVAPTTTINYPIAVHQYRSLMCEETLNLTGGTLGVDEPSQLMTAANISGGAIAGPGAITIAPGATVTWTSGSFSANANIVVEGALLISGVTARTQRGTMTNRGLITHSATGQVTYANATLTNEAAGVYDMQAGLLFNSNGTTNAFHNYGTLRKSTGAGSASIGIPFHQHAGGVTESLSGTLLLTLGGTTTGPSTLAAAIGAVVRYAGGTHLISGTVSGMPAGAVGVSLGTVDAAVGGGTINLSGTGFETTGGVLDGITNSGALRIAGGTIGSVNAPSNTGTAEWVSGTMRSFTNLAAGTLNITGGATGRTLTSILTNHGTVTHTATATINLTNAQIANQPGGIYDMQAGTLGNTAATTNAFNNSGVLRKSTGAGAASMAIPFNPQQGGAVECLAGTLNLSGGGVSSGNSTMTCSVGTTLRYSGGTHQIGGSISGAPAGTLSISGGVVQGAAGGGSINFGGTGFQVTGGTFGGGANMLTNLGLVTWTAASVAGFTNGAGGTLNISGTLIRTLAGTLINEGTVNHAATGNLNFTNGTLDTRAGSIYDYQSGALVNFSGTNAILNGGTFRKLSGAGTLTVPITFTNTGTIEVRAGTLSISGGLTNFSGGVLTGGAYVVSAALRFSGANIVTNSGAIVLDGTASQIADTGGANALLNLAGVGVGGALTLMNNRNFSANSTLSNAGAITIMNGCTLTAAGGFTQTAGQTLINAGGFLSSSLADIQGGTLGGTGTCSANVNNAGIVAPGASAGTLTISGNYTQSASGALSVELGGLAAGVDTDLLIVTGTAALDGALQVIVTDPQALQLNDEVDILTAAARTGEFDATGAVCLGDGNVVEAVYTPTAARLRYGGLALGDLTCDCALDGDDVTALIVALLTPDQFAVLYSGCSLLRCDLNSDMLVDGRDIQPFLDLLLGA